MSGSIDLHQWPFFEGLINPCPLEHDGTASFENSWNPSYSIEPHLVFEDNSLRPSKGGFHPPRETNKLLSSNNDKDLETISLSSSCDGVSTVSDLGSDPLSIESDEFFPENSKNVEIRSLASGHALLEDPMPQPFVRSTQEDHSTLSITVNEALCSKNFPDEATPSAIGQLGEGIRFASSNVFDALDASKSNPSEIETKHGTSQPSISICLRDVYHFAADETSTADRNVNVVDAAAFYGQNVKVSSSRDFKVMCYPENSGQFYVKNSKNHAWLMSEPPNEQFNKDGDLVRVILEVDKMLYCFRLVFFCSKEQYRSTRENTFHDKYNSISHYQSSYPLRLELEPMLPIRETEKLLGNFCMHSTDRPKGSKNVVSRIMKNDPGSPWLYWSWLHDSAIVVIGHSSGFQVDSSLDHETDVGYGLTLLSRHTILFRKLPLPEDILEPLDSPSSCEFKLDFSKQDKEYISFLFRGHKFSRICNAIPDNHGKKHGLARSCKNTKRICL